MKVKIGDVVYEVGFMYRTLMSRYGSNGQKSLVETQCYITKLDALKEKTECDEWTGSVTQHYNDPDNRILARKLAFTKALNHEGNEYNEADPFSKDERKIFWDEYKKTHRLTKRTPQMKNRELQEHIAKQDAVLQEMKTRIEQSQGIPL